MAKHFKAKKTLFFIKGVGATADEIEEALKFEPGVQFRSIARGFADTALETFDQLAGEVPARYQAAADAKAGKSAEKPADAPEDGQQTPSKPGKAVTLPQGNIAPPKPAATAGWTGNA